jgi:hypothetical protein
MCGCPYYCGNYCQHNGVFPPVRKRRGLSSRGLTIEKLYVEKSDDNHGNDRTPENHIGSSSGAAFAHENIGGAYHKSKVA